jgi:hypothetical protein
VCGPVKYNIADDFNCQLAAIDGSTMRLGLLCEETAAAACPAGSAALANQLAGISQSLRLLGGEIGRPAESKAPMAGYLSMT